MTHCRRRVAHCAALHLGTPAGDHGAPTGTPHRRVPDATADLFGAAIAQVACWTCCASIVLDRRGWGGDYGSPDDPQEFKACTPTAGAQRASRSSYPATMVITGDHGHPGHAGCTRSNSPPRCQPPGGPAPVLLAVGPVLGSWRGRDRHGRRSRRARTSTPFWRESHMQGQAGAPET